VPHDPQNVRVTGGLDRNSRGVPRRNEKHAVGNVSQATAGDPAARAHELQWQIMLTLGRPTTR